MNGKGLYYNRETNSSFFGEFENNKVKTAIHKYKSINIKLIGKTNLYNNKKNKK